MRRLFVPIAILLALAACGSTLKGPVQTDALEQVSSGAGLDIVSARQAALDFVAAYAHDDGGAALLSVVDGPKLRAWVHWFDLQNRAFPGTVAVSADVGSVRFVSTGSIGGVPGAEVNLGARLTFDYRPQGAAAFSVTRSLDGSMTLIRVGTGDWRVIDATPDGQPMDSAIQIFDSVEQAQQNVTVTVDSVFMFAPRWQFNVIVHNTIEGLVSVPSHPSARNRILEIPFALGGKLLKFQFALQGVVNPGPAPVPLPTATALAPAGST